jgi:hypothetical protein
MTRLLTPLAFMGALGCAVDAEDPAGEPAGGQGVVDDGCYYYHCTANGVNYWDAWSCQQSCSSDPGRPLSAGNCNAINRCL